MNLLSPQRRSALIGALAAGLSVRLAAQRAGVAKNTAARYLKQDFSLATSRCACGRAAVHQGRCFPRRTRQYMPRHPRSWRLRAYVAGSQKPAEPIQEETLRPGCVAEQVEDILECTHCHAAESALRDIGVGKICLQCGQTMFARQGQWAREGRTVKHDSQPVPTR